MIRSASAVNLCENVSGPGRAIAVGGREGLELLIVLAAPEIARAQGTRQATRLRGGAYRRDVKQGGLIPEVCRRT